MKKSIIRIMCFWIILGISLTLVNRVFKLKYTDGIYAAIKFYELEDNSVDVLILGSSHAFSHFNTATLWNEYGMAAYVFGASNQPMWNTYYYLKEALKTQKPELIILEGYRTNTFEKSIYGVDSEIIKSTYGLKWSMDKINALKVCAPNGKWKEFIPQFLQYHMRYKELSKEDFLKNQGNPFLKDWKGSGCNMVTTSVETVDVSGVENRIPLYEKTEEYYRKIIELAQENNIPIVVVISPHSDVNEEMEAIYNTAADIAKEYGVEFINCNLLLDDIGIDYTTDASDVSHLNWKGNQKFSRYIGACLKDKFAISDRRGDAEYLSWQRNADYISQMIYNKELTETSDLYSLINKISNENYWLFISVDGRCTAADEKLQFFYSAMGISNAATNGVWYRDNANGIKWCAQGECDEKYISTPAHDFCMKRWLDGNGHYNNQIIIDKNEYLKVGNGINIVVYDTVTESIVDCFGLNSDDNYNVVR